jgi:hypothetical protein
MRPAGVWVFSSGSRCSARRRSILSTRRPGRTGHPAALGSLATPFSASIRAILNRVGPVASPPAYLPSEVEQITHCLRGSPWSSGQRVRAISLLPMVSPHGNSAAVGFRQQSNRSN